MTKSKASASMHDLITDDILEMSRRKRRACVPELDEHGMPDMSHLNPRSGMSPIGPPPLQDYDPAHPELTEGK
jgi:hypothetical protein